MEVKQRLFGREEEAITRGRKKAKQNKNCGKIENKEK